MSNQITTYLSLVKQILEGVSALITALKKDDSKEASAILNDLEQLEAITNQLKEMTDEELEHHVSQYYPVNVSK